MSGGLSNKDREIDRTPIREREILLAVAARAPKQSLLEKAAGPG
jgi:hypothetical protein